MDLNSENFYGYSRGKKDYHKPQNCGSLLPICSTIQKQILGMEKWRKRQKLWGENAQQDQLHEERKTILLNPQNHGSLLSFTEQHKNRFPTIEEWRKMQENMKGRDEPPSTAWERQNSMRMGENESHGWIMAWACISKHLLAPQVKNMFSKNGGFPKFEFDLHTFPIPRK